jgi:O-antigen/teichoic acid export membrane protein
MPQLNFRLNFLLNLGAGGMMVIYAILSPMTLSRLLDPIRYSAYLLGVQVVPFILLLALPIQASLAPKFASLIAEQHRDRISLLVLVTLRMLLIAGGGAIFAAVLASWLLPSILGWAGVYADIAATSILVFGIATALTFPTILVTSFSAGCQNYLLDNIFKTAGPFMSLALITAYYFCAADLGSYNIEVVFFLYFLATVLCAFLLLVYGFTKLPVKITIFDIYNVKAESDVAGGVAGAYWLQICALLTVGSGPFIVSAISPIDVAAYSLTCSIMTIIAGVSSAMAGPFSIKIANLSSYSKEDSVLLFKRFQLLFIGYLFVSAALLMLMPQVLLTQWVGKELGAQIQQLLIPITAAMFVRQITAPYSAAVYGLGRQRTVWLSSTIEACVAILASVALGTYWGAYGVACGVLVSALIRLFITLVYDLRLTRDMLPIRAVNLLFPWQ